MRRRVALLALVAVLASSCSHRDRANPFDPNNPATRGRPTGFTAAAGNQVVNLTWDPISSADVDGFRVFRSVGSDPLFLPITDVIAPSQGGTSDFGLTNGIEYRYRLYFVFRDGVSGLPADDFAVPGPARPWITDLTSPQLVRMSADGHRVYARYTGFGGPSGVAVDPTNGIVWMADTYGGRLIRLDPGTGRRLAITDVSAPGAVAVDPRTSEVWSCDEDRNVVDHYDVNGGRVSPSLIGPFADPIAVAVDPNDGTVWVCENTGNRVRSFFPDGGPRTSVSVDRPSRVAVDEDTGDAWVTSFQGRRIARISLRSPVPDFLDGFQGPIGIAIDARRDRAWVADALANEVVVLDRSGAVVFRVPNLREVREIGVDPTSGEAWATVPGSGEVVRISPLGAVLARYPGFLEPYGVAVDPGIRTAATRP